MLLWTTYAMLAMRVPLIHMSVAETPAATAALTGKVVPASSPQYPQIQVGEALPAPDETLLLSLQPARLGSREVCLGDTFIGDC